MIQVCPGITRDGFLTGERYSQTLQKLIYLHLLADFLHEHFSLIVGTNTVAYSQPPTTICTMTAYHTHYMFKSNP